MNVVLLRQGVGFPTPGLFAQCKGEKEPGEGRNESQVCDADRKDRRKEVKQAQ